VIRLKFYDGGSDEKSFFLSGRDSCGGGNAFPLFLRNARRDETGACTDSGTSAVAGKTGGKGAGGESNENFRGYWVVGYRKELSHRRDQRGKIGDGGF
jgi:hypothetical protein